MRKIVLCSVIACSFVFQLTFQQVSGQVAKLPAYPLITHDPYFSVWSFSDELNASDTRHWTGARQPLLGYLKVDDTVYRFLGGPEADDLSVRMPGIDPAAAVSAELFFVNTTTTET